MSQRLIDLPLPDSRGIQSNLKSNLENNHLAHTILLSGNQGGTQFLHALRLAGEILKFHASPSKQDATANKALQLIHPDLHFLFPLFKKDQTINEEMEKFRSAVLGNPFLDLSAWSKAQKAVGKLPTIYRNSVHSIIHKLGLKPYEGNARVAIVWLAEYLGQNGNVLLKILEEPPKNTYFILVSENADNIISTVLSRCQRIQIPRLTMDEMEEVVRSMVDSESNHFSDLLYAAEGNVNYVLQNINEHNYSDTQLFRTWMQSCYRQRFDELIKVNEEVAAQKKDGVLRFLHNGQRIFRGCLSARLNPNKPLMFPQQNHEFIKKLANTISLSSYPELSQLFNEHIYQIERNLNPKIVLLNLATQTGNIIRNVD
jgi:DNA polymerase-3 subunit delta'